MKVKYKKKVREKQQKNGERRESCTNVNTAEHPNQNNKEKKSETSVECKQKIDARSVRLRMCVCVYFGKRF